jgi:mono/diheme cytochrome c family protein
MRVAVKLASLALLFGVVGEAQSSQRSVWDGVYSESQAARGAAVYAKNCVMCHGPALTGADGPPLTGVEFASNWNGLAVSDLDDRIRLTMPPDNPGKLAPQERVDVIAHILKVGAFPSGQEELPRDLLQLRQIRLFATKP